MAVNDKVAGANGAETSLDRLEAALDAIDRRIASSGLPQLATDPAVLHDVEQRLDAVIDHVKTILGRKSDQ